MSMITLSPDGMPSFVLQEGVDYDGQTRYQPPSAGQGPFVTFYPRSIPMGLKSQEAGRPIFDSVLFVRIQHPGERDCIDRRAMDEDARRYPKEYRGYMENRKSEGYSGTPLSVLFPAHPDTVEILRFHRVMTVEHLAHLSDTALHNVGMGAAEWKDKAIRYLDAVKAGAGFTAGEAEREKLERELKRQQEATAQQAAKIDMLQDSINRLTRELEASRSGSYSGPSVPRHAAIDPYLSADKEIRTQQAFPESQIDEPEGFQVGLDQPNFEPPAPLSGGKRQYKVSAPKGA